MRKVSAFCLTTPALVFLLITFVVPITSVLTASIHNPRLTRVMPALGSALRSWDGKGMPPEKIAAALAIELITLERTGGVPRLLNSRIGGFRSLMIKTRRHLNTTAGSEGFDAVVTDPHVRHRLAEIDSRWAERRYWAAMRQTAEPYKCFLYKGFTFWHCLHHIAHVRLAMASGRNGALVIIGRGHSACC